MGPGEWVSRPDEDSERYGSQSSVRYLLRRELVAVAGPENSAHDRSNLCDWSQRLLNYMAAFFCPAVIFSCNELSGDSVSAFWNCSVALAACPVAT